MLAVPSPCGTSRPNEPERIAETFRSLCHVDVEPDALVFHAETVIAEKYQAMTTLGIINTRMKDFYDVYLLSDEHGFDGGTLASAIRATFARRNTALPVEPPVALTRLYGDDAAKATQWRAFLNRSRLIDPPTELGALTDRLHEFLWPLTNAAPDAASFAASWLPGIGWTP